MRVLVVRLSALGDVVHTLPLLHWLRLLDPNCHIGWLVEPEAAGLLEGLTAINHLHIVPRKRWLKQLKNPLLWGKVVKEIHVFIKQLNAQGYTVALDTQGLLKSAVWPWLAGIGKRVGFARNREQSTWFYTQPVAGETGFNTQQSVMHSYKALLAPLQEGALSAQKLNAEALTDAAFQGLVFPQLAAGITLTASEQAIANWLYLQKETGRVVWALAPGTQWVSKHWPVSHWQTLLNGLSQTQHGRPVSILWLGSPKEAQLIASLEQANQALSHPLPSYNGAGHTRVQAILPLLAKVHGVIAPDSFILHAANWLASIEQHGKPQQGKRLGHPQTIGLFGPTSGTRTGPTAVNSQVLQTALPCQPCHKKHCPLPASQANACMQQLLPQQVLQTLKASPA